MARVTYVKKAQQRYEQKPVLDENGKPKIAVTVRTDKRGNAVTMRVMTDDKTRPLPNLKCEQCGEEIKPGDSYKHVTVKNTYGGTKHVRCATCPTWQPWDLSNSLSARLSQVSFDFGNAVQDANEPGDIETALQDAAQAVRDIAEEKKESAQNIEDGFQHPTQMSEELQQVGDDLDSWADEIEGADVPELPEIEPRHFVIHQGSHLEEGNIDTEGYETAEEAQADLDSFLADENIPEDQHGDYDVQEEEGEDLTEDQLQEWRDECADSLSIVDESPV